MFASSKLYYPQHVIDDVVGSLVSARTGAGAPTFATIATDGAGSTGVIAPRFSATIVNQLWFTSFIPHGYKINSDMDPHIHWLPSDANAGNVVFEHEFVGVNVGAVLGNTTIDTLSVAAGNAPVAAPGVALQHELVDFPLVAGAGIQMGQLHLCRFARLGNDGEDTYGSTVWVLQVDIHITLDSPGSGDGTHVIKNIQ